ncbi:WYL domain-containing protein [Streptomyces sp. NPDC097619]|uniref:helix-turn-helix transcriptional regulator n=1 Tax=Streptomyces sp. NPDC097619 TaxID=3157228 RepID=UPI00331BFC8E
MKSSRLLAILLLLQTRGRMTAAELARELEVSVRTIYRDAEALTASGVPLYGDAGHSGGYQLTDGYQSRLTGLSSGEADALFLTGMPGRTGEPGLGQALSAAQLKLRSALPPELRAQSDKMRLRFHLDAPGWYAEDADVPFLPQVADAVWRGRAVRVRLCEPTGPDSGGAEHRLEPYGLVLKDGHWHLVAGPGPRTLRVDRILALTDTTEEFPYPEGFDLAAHWETSDAASRAHEARTEVLVRVSPQGAAALSGCQAKALATTGRPDPELPGWTRALLPVASLAEAEREFLALGTAVEVLAPAALRTRMAATVSALAARYRQARTPDGPGGAPGPIPGAPAVPAPGYGPDGPPRRTGRAVRAAAPAVTLGEHATAPAVTVDNR